MPVTPTLKDSFTVFHPWHLASEAHGRALHRVMALFISVAFTHIVRAKSRVCFSARGGSVLQHRLLGEATLPLRSARPNVTGVRTESWFLVLCSGPLVLLPTWRTWKQKVRSLHFLIFTPLSRFIFGGSLVEFLEAPCDFSGGCFCVCHDCCMLGDRRCPTLRMADGSVCALAIGILAWPGVGCPPPPSGSSGTPSSRALESLGHKSCTSSVRC